ncbi:POTRA domain-containing protein [Salidesulfovibrio brasiliensis]|uniref:POTRA domain-containing protein n=1 Tax=Salidesulfovibrio brasiliensis TaxID=221711 RepID=UPI000A4F918E|nr:POTRA domain-containing protein [Salidesulfovibrio brasiliensis]
MPAKPLCSRLTGFLTIFFVLMAVLPAFAAPQTVQDDIKVAVLPFKVNASEDLQYLEDSFPALLSERLAESGFQVADQKQVKKLITDQAVMEVNREGAQQLALLLNSGFAIFGDFTQFGETFIIDAKVVDAFGDKEPVSIQVQKSGVLNLLPAVDELVNRMRSILLRQDVVAEVEVRGNKILDKEVVLMRLPIQKGQILTVSVVNEALKNIYDLGYFDDVKVIVDDLPKGRRSFLKSAKSRGSIQLPCAVMTIRPKIFWKQL